MFKPGVEVLVLFVDGRNPVEGSLLTGLGDWVELRDATGAIRAFPKASVHEVRRR
jgi:hypothetical protein